MELNSDLIFSFKYNSFFSEYLPSNFSIEPMNGFDIYSVPTRDSSDNVEPYFFTMSKFSTNDKRRLLYLPEVTAYLELISFMLENHIINDLCDFSRQDNNSFSQITQTENGVVFFIAHEGDYDETEHLEEVEIEETTLNEDESDDPSTYTSNIISKLNRAKGAKGVLSLDIANCYKSIYTHYLTAIKLGLDVAKQEFKLSKSNRALNNEDYLLYVQLDSYVRALNANESHGILTGPRISNYLVEAFLARIDIDIQEEIENHPQIEYTDFVRYVDDYEFFIYDKDDVDRIINLVETVLNRYRLTINDFKTQFLEFPYYVAKNLKRIYDRYTTETTITTETLVEMFNEYFCFEKGGVKGAIRYLVKSIQSNLNFENKELYTTFLLDVLVNDTRSLVKVCQLMIRDIAKIEITENHIKIIKRLLKQYIEKRMDLECIWLIYLLKKLNIIHLEPEIIDRIISSKNELAIVVLINEYSLTDTDYSRCVTNASSWILLYQLYLLNKISETEFSEKSTISKNLSFYNRLKYKGFSFYRN